MPGKAKAGRAVMASTDHAGAWRFALHGGTKTPEMAQFKSNFVVMHNGVGKTELSSA